MGHQSTRYTAHKCLRLVNINLGILFQRIRSQETLKTNTGKVTGLGAPTGQSKQSTTKTGISLMTGLARQHGFLMPGAAFQAIEPRAACAVEKEAMKL